MVKRSSYTGWTIYSATGSQRYLGGGAIAMREVHQLYGTQTADKSDTLFSTRAICNFAHFTDL